MAFKEGKLEFTVGGNGLYSGNYNYADIEVRTDDDKVKWSISIRCPANGTGNIPYTYLYFSIDGQDIYDKYYGNVGEGFPCKNGSSASGSITLKDSRDTSIPIVVRVGVNTTSYQYSTSKTLTRTYYTNGTVSKPVIADTGNNKFTIKGAITNGTNNAFESAKVYYTTNNTTPTTSSAYKTPTAAGDYSFTIDVPSSSSSSTVNAYILCDFKHNSGVTSTAEAKTVKYYTNGSVPPEPTITDNKNNTFTISGNVSKAGTNNSIKSSTLYYTIGSGSERSAAATTTSEGSYKTDPIAVPSGSASSTVKAKLVCKFNWANASDKTSTEASKTVKYYRAIGSPTISISDNGNNTFTVSGTDASGNWNNTAATTYQWGYTTGYGNSGTGTQSLTIATQANATRTVYAKATATPSWTGDSAKTATASLAVKQYVAPAKPGTPVISYTKSRLTIKENWTYTWTAASAINSSSPIKGYRIYLYKNGTAITGLTGSTSNNTISKGTGTNTYLNRDSTSCTITLSPTAFGFNPGDKIKLRVQAYTKNGKNDKLVSEASDSSESIVMNAGIVRVNVGGTWKEGQVYVNVNGFWKEADTVSVNVNGTWKESQ